MVCILKLDPSLYAFLMKEGSNYKIQTLVFARIVTILAIHAVLGKIVKSANLSTNVAKFLKTYISKKVK